MSSGAAHVIVRWTAVPFGVGNKVHAQSPSGGSKVRRGALVQLLVY